MTTWIPYTVSNPSAYIPVEKWGKDHWSTLAYLETVVVDHNGNINNQKMRCNPRLHRHFADTYHLERDPDKYPTRLRGGELQHNHDDWSCLEDMVAAGLIESEFLRVHDDLTFGTSKARVKLTDLGRFYAAELRKFKATGGNFADFVPPTYTVTIKPDPNCLACHGRGEFYDTVPYGSTTASMPSFCDCVLMQLPDVDTHIQVSLDLSEYDDSVHFPEDEDIAVMDKRSDYDPGPDDFNDASTLARLLREPY